MILLCFTRIQTPKIQSIPHTRFTKHDHRRPYRHRCCYRLCRIQIQTEGYWSPVIFIRQHCHCRWYKEIRIPHTYEYLEKYKGFLCELWPQLFLLLAQGVFRVRAITIRDILSWWTGFASMTLFTIRHPSGRNSFWMLTSLTVLWYWDAHFRLLLW